jgi:exopolyphosphatase/guanosine-5'-triphosphate,3'-diphosphate pyrophosphatase
VENGDTAMKPVSTSPKEPPAATSAPQDYQLAAVIDMGATSVRMVIAQIGPDGGVTHLENLQQATNLGKDTFTVGAISPETTEQCVEALRSFRRLLDEYGIVHPGQIRAVATSAVREASNREAFLDRITIGSGITVEVIDEAEVNRYTYLSVKPLLDREPELTRSALLVVEVGGGSTEFLALQAGDVSFSHSYRLGSLRVRETLEDFRAPAGRLVELLENQIHASVEQIRHNISLRRKPTLLILGGDARFAVAQLRPERKAGRPARLRVCDLSELTHQVLDLSVEDIVRRYHLSFQDAESLGPALLSYTMLAEALGLQHVLVAEATLRDGLLSEMARDAWTEEFIRQITNSAVELARKYDADLQHARLVAGFAGQIFQAMAEEHRLSRRYAVILEAAALLHEIGLFVNSRSSHKHTQYLILNSSLFGLGRLDLAMVALVARYHRQSAPKPSHLEYMQLDRERRMAVAKLAAILRVADALDSGHTQRIRRIRVETRARRLLISARRVNDVAVEQLALQQKGGMFGQVYGMEIALKASPA